MIAFNPPDNPYVQMLEGRVPNRFPLYCPGPPTPEFVAKYRQFANLSSPSVMVGEDDFLIPKILGFDAISLWQFRSPQKPPIALGDGTVIDAWGRKKRGKWYLNEGILTSEREWNRWVTDGFMSYPDEQKFTDLTTLLSKLTQGPLAGMAFDASLAGAFEKMWQGMGFSRFAKALKGHDPVIGVALDHLLDFSLGMADRWAKFTGIKHFILTDDMAYKGRPLIPPEDWEEWVLPRYQEFNKKIHTFGGRVILHSDGQVEPLIPLFIQAGFDALQALEPAAGVDICRVMKQYKGKLMLIGNLDVSDLLVYGNPSEVIKLTEKILSCARQTNARVTICPSQQIDEFCKPENISAMCQTVRDFNDSRDLLF